ncbi:zinc-ribbon and DUF3426 domain-containing protein [Marinicella rhabdoformis]|uniref:zinc-ribbon and DUF3426 domain-containing protein n=1 Tax=Marinicella rhabdoformis TaxID=2580566 RepID=UPI0012AED5D4|nr:zinc-ribbon and DUF3426 domain-containing protein [Marinicella rhabdoformis]
MFTQCRGCGEKFILEVEQLVHSRGQVRCNMCGTVFDALETLSAEKPLEDEDLLLHDFDNAPPLLTHVYDMDVEPDDDVLQVLNDLLPENLPPNEIDEQPFEVVGDAEEWGDEQESAEEVAPMFTENKVKKEKSPTGSGFWGLLATAMVVLICWQLVLVLQNGTLKLPEKPWAEAVCSWVACAQIKKEVDLGAISLVSRNIRPHPGRDQALMISASMINANESSAQFPVLEIKLSDLNGKVVGMRRFLPDEYVSDEIIASGFVKNTLVPFSLEIESPGDNAVAFEIGFVQP